MLSKIIYYRVYRHCINSFRFAYIRYRLNKKQEIKLVINTFICLRQHKNINFQQYQYYMFFSFHYLIIEESNFHNICGSIIILFICFIFGISSYLYAKAERADKSVYSLKYMRLT